MQVGDLVIRNPDTHSEGCDTIGVITCDGLVDEQVEVLWADGYRMVYSIYDLEAICE